MDNWKTGFLLGWPIFRDYVSFSECNIAFDSFVAHFWYPCWSFNKKTGKCGFVPRSAETWWQFLLVKNNLNISNDGNQFNSRSIFESSISSMFLFGLFKLHHVINLRILWVNFRKMKDLINHGVTQLWWQKTWFRLKKGATTMPSDLLKAEIAKLLSLRPLKGWQLKVQCMILWCIFCTIGVVRWVIVVVGCDYDGCGCDGCGCGGCCDRGCCSGCGCCAFARGRFSGFPVVLWVSG